MFHRVLNTSLNSILNKFFAVFMVMRAIRSSAFLLMTSPWLPFSYCCKVLPHLFVVVLTGWINFSLMNLANYKISKFCRYFTN